MAIKKNMKCWAIKVRGRSFYLRSSGLPWTFATKEDADHFAESITERYSILAKAVRVKVLIEEV